MAGPNILVVDDAPVNLRLMRLLLTHEGYEVRTAERAEDALRMLADYRPELILADIQMPGMNGLEMTRQVKDNPLTSMIKVVALTAGAMREDREGAMRAGCEDYITKPIDTTALVSKVRELLARPAAGHGVTGGPAPACEAPQTLSGPEMESLRRRFLSDGAEHSRRLLDSLNSQFDPAAAAAQLHEWIGSAGLLGHNKISDLSRQAEALLREEPVSIPGLRGVLTDLYLTFAELRDNGVAPVPDYVVASASGKRVALIGFTMERADAMCTMLERVKARPRLFDARDDPASEAIRDCELVLFHVRPETLDSSWLRPGVPVPAVRKLVFIGDRNDLAALAPEVRSRALDFLVGREESPEVLMRLAFAFSRVSDAVSNPPAVAAPVAADLPGRPRMSVANPRVVVADDDGIVLALVSATLRNYGMSCQSASNGIDALNLIRAQQPHVAVLDVNMPGMDGCEVLAAVRAEKIASRVILLTSLQQEKDILRAFNLGADDYLTKPFNPFELVARLKRLLQ